MMYPEEKEFFDKVRDAYDAFKLPGQLERDFTAAALALMAIDLDSGGLSAWEPDIRKRMDEIAGNQTNLTTTTGGQ
jgi:hypothetical protein